jgi:hypothetical protein
MGAIPVFLKKKKKLLEKKKGKKLGKEQSAKNCGRT